MYPLAELTQSGELPYYTPAQVAGHGVAADCWLSFLGKVVDVSELVRREHPELMQSIVAAAGSDISHWFTKDGELKTVCEAAVRLPQRLHVTFTAGTTCTVGCDATKRRATSLFSTRLPRIQPPPSTCLSRNHGGGSRHRPP